MINIFFYFCILRLFFFDAVYFKASLNFFIFSTFLGFYGFLIISYISYISFLDYVLDFFLYIYHNSCLIFYSYFNYFLYFSFFVDISLFIVPSDKLHLSFACFILSSYSGFPLINRCTGAVTIFADYISFDDFIYLYLNNLFRLNDSFFCTFFNFFNLDLYYNFDLMRFCFFNFLYSHYVKYIRCQRQLLIIYSGIHSSSFYIIYFSYYFFYFNYFYYFTYPYSTFINYFFINYFFSNFSIYTLYSNICFSYHFVFLFGRVARFNKSFDFFFQVDPFMFDNFGIDSVYFHEFLCILFNCKIFNAVYSEGFFLLSGITPLSDVHYLSTVYGLDVKRFYSHFVSICLFGSTKLDFTAYNKLYVNSGLSDRFIIKYVFITRLPNNLLKVHIIYY